MGFNDRLGFLLLGGAIGFVLGYIVRSLRDIKEELDEVETIVKGGEDHPRNEDGVISTPWIYNVAILIVVVVTAWASFISQKASNDIKDTQDAQVRISFCAQQYLSKTITALNERTTYAQDQAQKNVDLQQAQAQFLALLLHKPPYSEAKRSRAVQKYVETLNAFVHVSDKSADKVESFPYPTSEELRDCLRAAR